MVSLYLYALPRCVLHNEQAIHVYRRLLQIYYFLLCIGTIMSLWCTCNPLISMDSPLIIFKDLVWWGQAPFFIIANFVVCQGLPSKQAAKILDYGFHRPWPVPLGIDCWEVGQWGIVVQLKFLEFPDRCDQFKSYCSSQNFIDP